MIVLPFGLPPVVGTELMIVESSTASFSIHLSAQNFLYAKFILFFVTQGSALLVSLIILETYPHGTLFVGEEDCEALYIFSQILSKKFRRSSFEVSINDVTSESAIVNQKMAILFFF